MVDMIFATTGLLMHLIPYIEQKNGQDYKESPPTFRHFSEKVPESGGVS